jgi:hypothetical protein
VVVEAEAADEEGHHDVEVRGHYRAYPVREVMKRTGMPEPCL